MEERDTQIQREGDVEVDIDGGLDASSDVDAGLDTSSGETSLGSPGIQESQSSEAGWLRSKAGSIMSGQGVVIALVLSIFGAAAFSIVPFLDLIPKLLGIAVGTFLYGALSSENRYVESLVAGAIAGGGAVLWSHLLFSILSVSTLVLGIGIVGGALGGALGHYFGRDLRDGLTRDIGDTSGGGL